MLVAGVVLRFSLLSITISIVLWVILSLRMREAKFHCYNSSLVSVWYTGQRVSPSDTAVLWMIRFGPASRTSDITSLSTLDLPYMILSPKYIYVFSKYSSTTSIVEPTIFTEVGSSWTYNICKCIQPYGIKKFFSLSLCRYRVYYFAYQ